MADEGNEQRLGISVPRYDPTLGVRIDEPDFGGLSFRVVGAGVHIKGDWHGLRYLARWCLALSDESAPSGCRVHLDPGAELDDISPRVVIERDG